MPAVKMQSNMTVEIANDNAEEYDRTGAVSQEKENKSPQIDRNAGEYPMESLEGLCLKILYWNQKELTKGGISGSLSLYPLEYTHSLLPV